ncbi:uncharacterized protein LOC662426 [Tribolium castaneum]|uniref:Uncharacterized protein n=1 Tax=Tribolium castaneum TaxID=7070 RepID=D6W7S3_TRICA|nr:PREDICTED: uncharacterized protein LOC662426 [Tribolium castaneum]EFA11239.2 hypothetical protein TcasGA2_TC010771 [Tribolium castaneum]|eukprot:XP_008199443.1 PREDICTED: uncharacterized protein LOC662426 [Tribolium castaneum]
MLSDTDVEDHYSPSVRLITLERNGSNCGFHLTRSKWDPYPWVNSVEDGTAADSAGVKPGDCLLEVNGEDVVGQRISEVAEIVKSKPNQVSLLLWNAGVDPQCTPEAVCCGPMPTNLQRLSACMSTILAFLECPVCLDTIPPPTYQCENGHLICIRCRAKSERCPICRLRFSRGRSLLADQVYNALVDAFNLREEPDDSRTAKMHQIFKMKTKKNVPDIKVTPSHTTKFLARLVGKASSVDNLSGSANDSDFNLRTKSLSNQEIFDAGSPLVSRTNSVNRMSRNEKNQNYLNPNFRSVSCHGSFESLHNAGEDIAFYCPFAPGCTSLIKGKKVIEHFQLSHDGPLVHYFKSQITIEFSKILEEQDLCYVIQLQQNTFFLKIENSSENVLLWTWVLENGNVAKEFDMHVKVLIGETHDVIISVRNNVFSLNCTSYQEIKGLKKGLLVNTRAINGAINDVIFDIAILKSDV